MLPEDVASAFVSQYYMILQKCPHNSHKFYGELSLLTWPEPNGGGMKPVKTLNEIDKKILSSDYKDYTVNINTVDSQPSQDGGVIVAVTGSFIDKDQVTSNFYQTFFLAKQTKGFFVLNDILQVSDVSGTTNNAETADSYVGSNVSESHAPSSTKSAGEIENCNVESVVPATIANAHSVTELASNGHDPSVVPDTSEDVPPVVDLALNVDVSSVAVSTESAAVTSAVELALNTDVAAVVVPTASAGVPRVVNPSLKAKEASVAVPGANAVVPSVAEPSSRGNGTALATWAPNASQKISYASMVAKLAQATSPRAASVTPKVSSPLPNGSPKALALSSSVPKPLAIAPKLSTGGSSTSDTTRARSESRGVYVGRLPYDITKQGIVDALKKFGPVRRFSDSVQIRRYDDGFCCAFVEFESEDSARRAVEIHHVKIGEKESYISSKKSSYNRDGNGNRSNYDSRVRGPR